MRKLLDELLSLVRSVMCKSPSPGGADDSGKNAFALSKTLAEAIGRSFIETALDS
jgi:hypothetical protein